MGWKARSIDLERTKDKVMINVVTKFPIYTSQLNVGKVLKNNASDILFIDVTLKSGDAPYKELFAPTWDLLNEFKTNGDWQKYVLGYYKLIAGRDCVSTKKFLGYVTFGKTNYKSIVLGCYCGDVHRCHRSLAAKMLVDAFGAVYKGDLTSKDIVTYTDVMANNTVVDMLDSVELSSNYKQDWLDRKVLICELGNVERDVTIFSKELMDAAVCRSVEELGITQIGDYAKVFINRIENAIVVNTHESNDPIVNMVSLLTVYQVPQTIENTAELDSIINSRCFITKHKFTK